MPHLSVLLEDRSEDVRRAAQAALGQLQWIVGGWAAHVPPSPGWGGVPGPQTPVRAPFAPAQSPGSELRVRDVRGPQDICL